MKKESIRKAMVEMGVGKLASSHNAGLEQPALSLLTRAAKAWGRGNGSGNNGRALPDGHTVGEVLSRAEEIEQTMTSIETKMSKLYKLTDENGQTKNNTQWGPGVSHSGTGKGELCGKGYIHAYEHPLLAVLLNPIYGNFKNPRMWQAKGIVAKRDGQIKCGCVTLTTECEIPVPDVTTEMRVRFAILCVKRVWADRPWNAWADNWLTGADRSEAASWEAAEAASWEAAESAEAAGEAAYAAEAASWAAAEAAEAASWAAESAESAAESASWAARAAAREVGSELDLITIAEEACRAV